MKIEIRPFTDKMMPAAGNLLAQRHKRNRAMFPLLPARFEGSRVAAQAVSVLQEKKFTCGYAAFKDEELIAYLIGEHTIQPWGRCGYVYLPGYALAENENAALIQDLYARLGDEWIKKGVFSHGVYVSAADADIIEALFNIGFGKERVDAILDLRTLVIPKNIEEPTGVTIRKAGKGDNARIGSLSHIIMNALADPPYWHPTTPEHYSDLQEGWSELADDPDWTVWLALEDRHNCPADKALGATGFKEQKESDVDMLVAPKTIYLSIAATQPAARGRGISAALTWRGLEQARQEGFEICHTDWISPNLPAARHWIRFGFKAVAYRLSKRVDPMIAWTRQEAHQQLP